MLIRSALPSDLPHLRRWDRMDHVIAGSGHDDETDWAAALARQAPWCELLIADVMGRPIGALQIINPADDDTGSWGNVGSDLRAINIWIGEPDMVGKGYGTLMMRMALAGCFADAEVSAVVVDPLVSNVRAIAFYQRIGFRRVERRRFGRDECLVLRVERSGFQFQPG